MPMQQIAVFFIRKTKNHDFQCVIPRVSTLQARNLYVYQVKQKKNHKIK